MTALNYVEITGTWGDGSGTALSGTVTFTPSQTVYASGAPLVTPGVPVQALINGGQLQAEDGGQVRLLATDNEGLSLAGGSSFWYWSVSVEIQAGASVSEDSWDFPLPYSADPVDLYSTKNLVPASWPNPMTEPGDIITAGAGGSPERIAGNSTTAREFLTSQGTGTAAQAPVWGALQAGDIPVLPYAPETSGTSLLKGNGSGGFSAAAAGTDYLAPTGNGSQLTGITPSQVGADASGAAAAAQSASLQKSANLSDLASASTARTNLGLGTAATQNSGAFDASGAAAAAQSAAEAASDPAGSAAAAQAAAEAASIPLSQKGASSGVATLDSGGHVPTGQIPTVPVANGGTGQTTAPAARVSLGLAENVYTVDAYGGDPSGVSDSAAAFNAALAAMPTVGGYPFGTVEFGTGAYKIQGATTNPGPYVTVRGQGRYATWVYKYGSGNTFRMWSPVLTTGFPFQTGFAGGIKGLTIDGSNASAGAIGLVYGDLNDGQIDVAIQHFNLAGSAGLQLRNTVNWTEKTHASARLWDNTVNVQFTVTDGSTQTGVTLSSAAGGTAVFTIESGSWPADFTAGVLAYGSAGLVTPSSAGQSTLTVSSVSGTTLTCAYTGTAPSGTSGSLTQCNGHNSFSYNDFEFDIAATLGYSTGSKNSGQMGVQFTNGAVPVGTRLVVRGNFQCSDTTQFDTSVFPSGPAVLNLDGAMPNYHPNQGTTFMEACNLQLQVEGDPDAATYQPTTILFTGSAAGAGANGIGGCWGGMYFDAGSLAPAQLGSNPNFHFMGPVIGDLNLNPANQDYHDNGRPVIAGGTPYLAVTGLDANSNTQNRLVGGTASGPPAAGAHLAGDVSCDLAGQYWVCDAGGNPGSWSALVPLDSDAPAAGVFTMNPNEVNSIGIALTSQTVYFTYFTAPRAETVTQVIFGSGNTAAGATPTLVEWGLFTADGSGNLTRVAVTPNNTALFASGFTKYSESFSAGYAMVPGQRYALGLLVVSGAAMPTMCGNYNTSVLSWSGPVRKMSSLTGQSSMPSSVTAGSLAWGTSAPMLAYVSP